MPPPPPHRFFDKLNASLTDTERRRQRATLAGWFRRDGAVRIEEVTDLEDQKRGLDWKVHLSDGRILHVDDKRLGVGQQRYWDDPSDPELPLEVWSRMPRPDSPEGKLGWAKNPGLETDLITFTCAEAPEFVAMLNFRAVLRLVAEREAELRALFKPRKVPNPSFVTEVIFVPVSRLVPLLAQYEEPLGPYRPDR